MHLFCKSTKNATEMHRLFHVLAYIRKWNFSVWLSTFYMYVRIYSRKKREHELKLEKYACIICGYLSCIFPLQIWWEKSKRGGINLEIYICKYILKYVCKVLAIFLYWVGRFDTNVFQDLKCVGTFNPCFRGLFRLSIRLSTRLSIRLSSDILGFSLIISYRNRLLPI